MNIFRYEPFFDKTLFSHIGELYLSDEQPELSNITKMVKNASHPFNGLSAPTRLQVQFTNRCNLRCPHCYVSSGNPLPNELSNEEIERLLKKSSDFGILQIEWSGGEVFSRKGFLEMVTIAKKYGFDQNLLTNGVAIGTGFCAPKYLWRYFYAIQISVDGIGDKFDSFVGKNHWHNVDKAIELLLKNKPRNRKLSLTTTLDKSNINSLSDIYSYVSGKDVSWKIARQVHNGRSLITEDESDQLLLTSWEQLEHLRQKRSRARITHPFSKKYTDSVWPVEWQTEPGARWFMYVGASGNCYPFPYFDGVQQFYGGNVLHDSLPDIWNSRSFQVYRDATRDKTKCMGCDLVCQMWPRPFNFFKHRKLLEDPIDHPNCPLNQQRKET